MLTTLPTERVGSFVSPLPDLRPAETPLSRVQEVYQAWTGGRGRAWMGLPVGCWVSARRPPLPRSPAVASSSDSRPPPPAATPPRRPRGPRLQGKPVQRGGVRDERELLSQARPLGMEQGMRDMPASFSGAPSPPLAARAPPSWTISLPGRKSIRTGVSRPLSIRARVNACPVSISDASSDPCGRSVAYQIS